RDFAPRELFADAAAGAAAERDVGGRGRFEPYPAVWIETPGLGEHRYAAMQLQRRYQNRGSSFHRRAAGEREIVLGIAADDPGGWIEAHTFAHDVHNKLAIAVLRGAGQSRVDLGMIGKE